MQTTHVERETNAQLTSKLEDQRTITQKTEFALQKVEELVSTKSMLIENLQAVISRGKETQSSCSNFECKKYLTSHSPSTNNQDGLGEVPTLTGNGGENLPSNDTTIPGLCETMLKLKGIGLHGVTLDGLLLWVDTKRRTIPEDSWKQQVFANFTAEEITNVKNILWDVANTNDLLGRNIARKGDSKSISEINDICGALKTLSEKQKMPVFIATSTMVMQSPEAGGDSNQQLQCLVDTKLNNLQKHLDESLQKHADQSSKNHDRIISKAEVGQKKIDDVLKKLNVIDENVVERSFVETPPYQNPGTVVIKRPIERRSDAPSNRSSPMNNQRNILSTDERVIQGTVDLVIKGLNVDVTGEDLTGFLQRKGVDIKECNLLTTFSDAKTLAYKITIDADKQNVVSDPSTWPENVNVQLYKQRRRNSLSPVKKSTGNKRSVRVTEAIDNNHVRSVVENLGGLSVRFENAGTRNSLYSHIVDDC